MDRFEIPQDLVKMARERRLIPFVGAGFSSAIGLLGWGDLLRCIGSEVDPTMNYSKIEGFCNNDQLQIAEYFYLKCDRSVGPMRHTIAKEFAKGTSPVLSAAHVELVNLGAPQIYTTNYDEAIETTYRSLRQPVDVVAIAKHVATLRSSNTQVVKYHGDLRHDHTLVLTESSYYSRLDFESPMDLKFRSDILGRSVLFMGYSFRDINIRIIWFKLMRMMKDIHPSDRPTSYIVTLSANPVLELLFDEVGIKTIVLDPSGTATTVEKKNELLAEFLSELANTAAPNGRVPGTDLPLFLSRHVINRIAKEIDAERANANRYIRSASRLDAKLSSATNRRIPELLAPDVATLLTKMANSLSDGMAYQVLPTATDLAVKYTKSFGAHPAATVCIARGLAWSPTRTLILSDPPEWTRVWGAKLNNEFATLLIDNLSAELEAHKENRIDHDLAYAADNWIPSQGFCKC